MSRVREFERQKYVDDKYWDAMNDGSWYRCAELGKDRDDEILESREYKNWLEDKEKLNKMEQEVKNMANTINQKYKY
jgi:hypothetical protein